ncbi:MAG TPA: VWA domain-containing protein, partial [Nitratifractor sp.]|nr:VWA domain-containing protein [Nitratifractor sp.]
MQSIEFLYPIAFLLLPLYLFLVWFVKKYYRRVGFSNVKLLKKALYKSFDYSKILKLAIVALLATALATPVTKENVQAKSKRGYDISLLVDASNSMQEENRFTIAKEIVANFIKERKSDNIALTLFANYAYVASPLTYEKESLLKVLQY